MKPPGKILLVEDNAGDVDLILAALAKSKFTNEVVVVRDGGEALDYLYRRGKFHARPPADPTVIFLDLKMPKVAGLEVLRQIKRDAQLNTIPVVILTASRDATGLAECYQSGANSCVVKPVDFQQFAEAIRQLGTFWAVVNEPPQQSAKR